MNTYARYSRPLLHPECYRPYPLEEACAQMRVEKRAVHRAEVDTLSAYHLLRVLMRKAAEEKNACSQPSFQKGNS